MLDFGDRVKIIRERSGLNQEELGERLGLKKGMISAVEKGKRGFSYPVLVAFATEFSVSLDWLCFGDRNPSATYRDVRGDVVPADKIPDFAFVPIQSQKVSAGPGQEALDNSIVGWLPVPLRMFRGEPHTNARAAEVRGDSMTGINMMDGDLVIFAIGSHRGNGLYVLRVGDELLVKRVAFDRFHKQIIITSENPRYPERVELVEDDLDNVTIIGKVYGWTHVHPY